MAYLTPDGRAGWLLLIDFSDYTIISNNLELMPPLINRKEWRGGARSKDGAQAETQPEGDNLMTANEHVCSGMQLMFVRDKPALTLWLGCLGISISNWPPYGPRHSNQQCMQINYFPFACYVHFEKLTVCTLRLLIMKMRILSEKN